MTKVLILIFSLLAIQHNAGATVTELPIHTTGDDEKNVEFTATVGNGIKLLVNYWFDTESKVWRMKIEEQTELGDRYTYVDDEEIIADKAYFIEQPIDVGRILVSDESGKHKNPTDKPGDLGGRVKIYHFDKQEIIDTSCKRYPLSPRIGQDESLILFGCFGAAKLSGENAAGKVYLVNNKIISVSKGKIVRWIAAP